MKARIGTGALALALFLCGCGADEGGNLSAAAANNSAPLEQIPAPNNGNWAEVVTRTPEGFLMGNPDAPVKLVEYASYTCPHCATFSEEATAPLRDNYIRSGQVSWEFRSFLRNAQDVVFTILTRCQTPAAFFRTTEQIFEQQQELMSSSIDEAEAQRIGALPPEQQIAPAARAMELDTFFARRGMPESQFAQCLANPAGVQEATNVTNRAMSEMQVSATPSFFINGEQAQATGWPTLEPLLRGAIGG